MEAHPLKKYLRKGEGLSVEFKQTLNSEYKIAKTICSLANSAGGVILVGVKDNKNVIGVDPEEEKHILNKAAGICKPPVPLELEEIGYKENEEEEERIVLKVMIRESNLKPHYVLTKNNEWKVYQRQQDKTILAGSRALEAMSAAVQSSSEPGISNHEKRLLDYIKKNERITLKKFSELVSISENQAQNELDDALFKGIIRALEHENIYYYVI